MFFILLCFFRCSVLLTIFNSVSFLRRSSIAILQRWDSLPEVERLATKNISLLVETVEKEMRTERSGWRATSDSMKKIKQAVSQIQNGSGGGSGSPGVQGPGNALPPDTGGFK